MSDASIDPTDRYSLYDQNKRALDSTISVRRNDRQLVLAVEDDRTPANAGVLALDPLADRWVIQALIAELLKELQQVYPEGPAIVADAVLEGTT